MRIQSVAFAAIASTLLAAAATAEEVKVPQPSETKQAAAGGHPSRGTTMEQVRAKFGAPAQEDGPVGQPPITRWVYPGYTVFFEHDKVLHTVVNP